VAALGTVIGHKPEAVVLRIDSDHLRAALADALSRLPIRDLTVEDPPLEELMAEIFAHPHRASTREEPTT
jgi:ABC-2 type transport system ATP-binding protein